MYIRSVILLAFLGFFSTGACLAQWNAIAGYDISNADAGAVNQLLHAFNDQYEHTKPFTDIRVLHGFTAGFRYQYRLGAFELVYNRRFTRRIGDVFQIDSLPANGTNADFFYEIRTFSYTAEFGRGVTVGGSIDYNEYLTELKYDLPKYRDFKIKQYTLGSHLFVGTHVANRHNLSFSVRAYYQFNWDNLTTRNLREKLELVNDEPETYEYNPGTFGLTIIINNGPQRR